MIDQQTDKQRIRLTFAIDEDPQLIDDLDRIARSEDLSRSQIMRRALRLFVTNYPPNQTIQRPGREQEA